VIIREVVDEIIFVKGVKRVIKKAEQRKCPSRIGVQETEFYLELLKMHKHVGDFLAIFKGFRQKSFSA